MSFKRLTFSFGALALALIAAPHAQAQTCQTTNDCHKGFVCIQNTATPAPTAPPGSATADPSAPTKTSALVAPSAGGYCQAAECASDTDCGLNMVCHTEQYSMCTGGGAVAPCAPNTDCIAKPVDMTTCTDVKVSRCAFTWQLPCNTDTDCGAGFMCNPTVSGSCSGSSGSATAGTGTSGPAMTGGGAAGSAGATKTADPGFAAPVPPDQTCTTTTSFPGYCQPKATTCASNTDCPTDWTCVAQQTPDRGGPTIATGAAGTSGTTSSPGAGVPASDALLPAPGPTPPVTMVCTSPYGYGGYGAVAVDSGTPKQGGTGTTTAGTGAAGGPGGSIPPTTPSPTHESAGTSPSTGCAVAGGSSSSAAFAALALLGLALARRRR
jgi:MYXO-CTERM domain-containing protein